MNSNKAHVSVIIPCYNIGQHLSKCIESVLSQTFSDFELLLLDDGSTDETFNICARYQQSDARIRFYNHKNKGVSYTRNRGIELALGDYIMFIDGDDFVKPDIIEQLTNYLAKGTWPMCGMLLVENGVSKERDLYKVMLQNVATNSVSKDDVFKIIYYHNLSTPCCRLYDLSILKDENIRFRENISYQEDLIFNLEYCKYIEDIQLLNYYGYFYVKHQSSSTSRYHKHFDHINLLLVLLKGLEREERDTIMTKKIIFDAMLKEITNEFHPDAPSSLAAKRKKVYCIFQKDYFSFSYDNIPESTIHPVFKFLLRSKNSRLLTFFLYILFYKK